MIELQQIKSALNQVNLITPKVSELQPSAVLFPLVQRENGLHVLLTQRTDHLRHHAGQISFPGGRMDHDDKDLIHTALRETHEEIGVEKQQITILGKLQLQPTATGFMIQPIVGLIDSDYEMILSEDEVADAFEVPLDFLANPKNHEKTYREFHGVQYPLYSIPYQNRNIWGATANIIVQLSKLIARSSSSD